MVAATKPAWLEGLMSETFFSSCGIHEIRRKSEKNVFCLLCCLSVCPHCLPSHRPHPLLQVKNFSWDIYRMFKNNMFIGIYRNWQITLCIEYLCDISEIFICFFDNFFLIRGDFLGELWMTHDLIPSRFQYPGFWLLRFLTMIKFIRTVIQTRTTVYVCFSGTRFLKTILSLSHENFWIVAKPILFL